MIQHGFQYFMDSTSPGIPAILDPSNNWSPGFIHAKFLERIQVVSFRCLEFFLCLNPTGHFYFAHFQNE